MCPRPALMAIDHLNARSQDYIHYGDILLKEYSSLQEFHFSGPLVNIPKGQWLLTVKVSGTYLQPGTDYKELMEMKAGYFIRDCRGKQISQYSSSIVDCAGTTDFEIPTKKFVSSCKGGEDCVIKGGSNYWYHLSIGVSSLEKYLSFANVKICLEKYPPLYPLK